MESLNEAEAFHFPVLQGRCNHIRLSRRCGGEWRSRSFSFVSLCVELPWPQLPPLLHHRDEFNSIFIAAESHHAA